MLRTLVPFGTATTGWRATQENNDIYITLNAKFDGTNWSHDDTALDAAGLKLELGGARTAVIYRKAAASTWLSAAWLVAGDFGNIVAAVNHLTLVPSIAGVGPEVNATGTDANIGVLLRPKGTGKVEVMANPMLLAANPVAVLDAATKQYVDAFAKKLDVEHTQISVTNTTIETQVFIHTVPANTLAVGKVLRFKMKGNVANNNLGSDMTIRVKFGTLLVLMLVNPSNTTAGVLFNFDLDILLVANAADSERASAMFVQAIAANGATGSMTGGGIGAATRAFNVDSDFEVTVQWTTASVNNIFNRELAILELLP